MKKKLLLSPFTDEETEEWSNQFAQGQIGNRGGN